MNKETLTPPPRQRFRWLRRGAIDLGDVVVQILAVVVGILLALFINDWGTERQQRRTVDEAMHAVHAELAANRAALLNNAEWLHKMAAHLESATENRNQAPRPCYGWPQWGGTGIVNLVDAAYQTAIATQALSYMPFEQAQRVAQAYGYQHSYQQIFNLIRSQFGGAPHTAAECVLLVKSLGHEEQLLDTAYSPLIGPDKAKWSTPTP